VFFSHRKVEGNMKRIVIKLSGEALANTQEKTILEALHLSTVAKAIKTIQGEGLEVAVVIGAGNIWRGKLAKSIGIESSTADYMGMLGTIINSLALQSALENEGVQCRVLSSIHVEQVAENYIRRRAIRHLEKGRVVIFAGGTGSPYFSTDTTASLRAMEIHADTIFMAKNGVAGVYDSDPKVNANAKLIKHITFDEMLNKKLAVMDLTAVSLIKDSPIVIRVFDMKDTKNLLQVIKDHSIGTTIQKGAK
jgi:uridylate kinase